MPATDRTAWLLVGAGLSVAAYHLFLFAGPVAAGLVPLLLLAAIGPRRTLSPGSILTGGALGLWIGLSLLTTRAGPLVAAGALLASAILLRRPRPDAFPSGVAPACCAGAAAGFLLVEFGGAALRACGLDAASLVFAAAPLLVLLALGAALASYLSARHPRVRPLLAWAAAAAVPLLAWRAPSRADSVLDLAQAIQQPCVSREQYLWGVALLAVVFGGSMALAVGAATGVALRATRGSGGAALGMAVGVALALLVPAPFPRAAAAALAPLALAAAPIAPASRIVALVAALAAGLVPAGIRFDDSQGLCDPMRTAFTRDADAGIRLRGRPVQAPLPPGWPGSPDPLADVARIARDGAGARAVCWLGTEAAIAGRLVPTVPPGDAAAQDDRDPGALVLLPSLFADPLNGLVPAMRRIARAAPETAVVAACDLAEVGFDGWRAATAATVDRSGPCRLLLSGTLAILVRGAAAAPSQPPSGAIPLLSAQAVQRLRDRWGSLGVPDLLLAGERSRPGGRRPGIAADAIRRLLVHSDLPARDPGGDSFATRVRIAWLAAILADDAREEERLLRVLERLGVEPVPRWRAARAAARDELREWLYAARQRDRFDVDVRHRLGRVLLGQDHVLAGLDELTDAVMLRPKLAEAHTDLAEAYLVAQGRGERKRAGELLDNLKQVFAVDAFALRHLPPERPAALLARDECARGEALMLQARAAEGAERDALLHDALGRFSRAHELDRILPAALRGQAQALAELGLPGAADQARAAVTLDPLDPDSRLLLARLGRDAGERRNAVAHWLLLR